MVLNGYSWCEKPLNPALTKCVIADSPSAEEIVKTNRIKPVVVEPEALIDVEFDKKYNGSLRSFEITSYHTQEEKGILIYNIHTEWAAEQG
ncbi:hypothetical protein [Ammoniphilus oxalaticus]|uniref:hypothetical protein n=1 Tax=Ammoniphilus oxalaticus TaxID=66863 RepID=UPI0011C34366|nr:hypothetical protein [Ammoniphilus oxalaticus]